MTTKQREMLIAIAVQAAQYANAFPKHEVEFHHLMTMVDGILLPEPINHVVHVTPPDSETYPGRPWTPEDGLWDGATMVRDEIALSAD